MKDMYKWKVEGFCNVSKQDKSLVKFTVTLKRATLEKAIKDTTDYLKRVGYTGIQVLNAGCTEMVAALVQSELELKL